MARGISDYFVDELPRKIRQAEGVPLPMGPSDAPLGNRGCDWLNDLKTQIVVSPRKKVPFLVPSGIPGAPLISVPNGMVYTTVCSYTVDQRHTGYLQKVGVAVVPAGNIQFIDWQIEVSGEIYSKFNALTFAFDSLLNADDFEFEICAGATIVLLARNSGAAPLSVAGKLQGWTALITGCETFGVTPEAAQ